MATIEDRLAIGELMTGWIHRDLGDWDALAGLFDPDAKLRISWFEGPAAQLLLRQSIYDMSGFTFPAGPVDIDAERVARHPLEYGALAYLLEASGFPVTGTYPTKGRDAEAAMRADAGTWLTSGFAA